jgi:hypothetical protein
MEQLKQRVVGLNTNTMEHHYGILIMIRVWVDNITDVKNTTLSKEYKLLLDNGTIEKVQIIANELFDLQEKLKEFHQKELVRIANEFQEKETKLEIYCHTLYNK